MLLQHKLNTYVATKWPLNGKCPYVIVHISYFNLLSIFVMTISVSMHFQPDLFIKGSTKNNPFVSHIWHLLLYWITIVALNPFPELKSKNELIFDQKVEKCGYIENLMEPQFGNTDQHKMWTQYLNLMKSYPIFCKMGDFGRSDTLFLNMLINFPLFFIW